MSLQINSGFFYGPKSKISRAQHHIDELHRLSNPLDKQFYKLAVESSRSHVLLAEPNEYCFVYRPNADLTTQFSSVIGDVINNLREALDHLINRTAEHKLGKPIKAAFPFGMNMVELMKAPAFIRLQTQLPNVATFIASEIKPTQYDSPALWAITNFSNMNKHNDFIPLISATGIDGLTFEVGTNTLSGGSFIGNASEQIGIVRADSPIKVSGIASVNVEMTFLGSGPFGGRSVQESLTKMKDSASEVINKFDAIISQL